MNSETIPEQTMTPTDAALPGPRWKRLVGNKDLTIALVSLYVIENTGIRLLAAILRNAGVKVHEVYFKDWVTNRIAPPTPQDIDLLMAELQRIAPDMIGMSVRASAFHRIATDLTVRMRSALNVPVLWGGMHSSSCPDEAAKVADLVCIGEAELTIMGLATALRSDGNLSDVEGLWFHDDQGLVCNETAQLVSDLDSLPFPDYHSTDKVFIENGHVDRGHDPCTREAIYLVMGSRGCPFPSCTFCSNSVVHKMYPGQKYHRTRSVTHMLDEIQYARQHFPRLKRIRFDDEEFPTNPAWFDEFCERWPKEVDLPFEIHMDPRVVTADRLERLKAVGLSTIFMGIQHTEQINRSLYGRNVSDEQVLTAARAIRASGVRAGYQVILDDPVSTSDDKRRLLDLLLELPHPYEMVLFSLTVYPGSTLADDLKARDMINDQDIEGEQTKVFRQFRVDLSYPRPTEDRFWTALYVMVSKPFIPKCLLRGIARSRFLNRHPLPVTLLAYATNVLKLGLMGIGLLIRGELSWAVIRRWLNFKSLVTY
jgi:anaerobic magnesium-protoporphyrin IX monomethyl ester cyclase